MAVNGAKHYTCDIAVGGVSIEISNGDRIIAVIYHSTMTCWIIMYDRLSSRFFS